LSGKEQGNMHSVNNFKQHKNRVSWIINFIPIDHVLCSLNNFVNYSSIIPIIIKLPNGKHVKATHKGTMKFSRNLVLKDVLYIPDFDYNLNSISKLALSHNLELIFVSNSCIIQDLKTKERICIVDVRSGLYALCLEIDIYCCVNTIHDFSTTLDMWYLRMRNLLAKRLEIMKKHYP